MQRMKKMIVLGIAIAVSISPLLGSPVWLVTAKDASNYNPCFVGNGIVGISSNQSGLKTNDVIINGLYDCLPGGTPTLTKYYKPLDISVSIKGLGDVVFGKNVTSWEQTLNLKEAVLYTSYRYAEKLIINTRLLAFRNKPMCAMNSVEFEALEDVDLTISNKVNLPNRENIISTYKTLTGFQKYKKVPVMFSSFPNLSGSGCIAGANTYYFSGVTPETNYSNPTTQSQQISFDISLKKGQKYTFSIVSSFTHSGFTDDPFNDALRLCANEHSRGIEPLIDEHKQQWDKLWQNDIEIEGDDNAQRDVRVALYSLYSSIRDGFSLSIPPNGLAGTGWNGHIFWDAEIWMYPALLVMNKSFAQSMIDFRYNTRLQSRKTARQFGYKGIMFPWESDMNGNECTPVSYKIDMNEHHITADVGIAFWNYYLVTQDKNWLQQKGYSIIKDVADFWASRAVLGSDGKYHILNVIGPDEWHEDIDDNAYTNGAAATCLRNAIKAAQILNEKPEKTWKDVAEGLEILTSPEGHTLQYKGYKGQTIKQADANLLAYPLNIIDDKNRILKDLEYYEPLINPNGPAMSQSVLATIYARLGNVDKAYQLFNDSYKTRIKPPFNFMSEKPNNNGIFCTGYGGLLQAIIYGFGGLQITDNGIVQKNPVLPKQWKSLVIRIGDKKYLVK